MTYLEKIRKALVGYGEKVRQARIEKKLTQLEVANELECSQAIISFIETGQFIPSYKFSEQLNKLLGVKYDWKRR